MGRSTTMLLDILPLLNLKKNWNCIIISHDWLFYVQLLWLRPLPQCHKPHMILKIHFCSQTAYLDFRSQKKRTHTCLPCVSIVTSTNCPGTVYYTALRLWLSLVLERKHCVSLISTTLDIDYDVPFICQRNHTGQQNTDGKCIVTSLNSLSLPKAEAMEKDLPITCLSTVISRVIYKPASAELWWTVSEMRVPLRHTWGKKSTSLKECALHNVLSQISHVILVLSELLCQNKGGHISVLVYLLQTLGFCCLH